MYSKKCSQILLIVIMFLLLALIILMDPACKSSDDFTPPEDTLLIPPSPPSLLSPIDHYVRMPEGPTGRLLFTWSVIEDAELYEIYYVGDTFDEWITTVDTNCYSFRMEKEPWEYLFGRFIWKVRAGSVKWQYYTDWSATRNFEIRLKPPPPQLLGPAPDTTLVFDTLPAHVFFDWDTVQDEQYYNIFFFKDTILFNDLIVPVDSCSIAFDSAGTYYWQVRCGSNYWQYSTDWSAMWQFKIQKIGY